MAYRVDKFNGTFLINVEDGTIDTTTDLRFVGKNYAGYGEVQNENFLHLLENFANTTAPPKAVVGQIWFDSSSNKLKYYDGSRFKVTSGAEVTTTAPAGLSSGELWFDSSADQLYVWNGTEFVLVGPESAPDLGNTVFQGQVVKNNTGGNETIARMIVGSETIGIISRTEFTLDSITNPITGFSVIKKGFNLVNTNSTTGVTSSDHYYWGTASNALSLQGFTANDFVKTGDVSFTSAVAFSDSGVTIGDQQDFKIFVESGDETIIQNQLGNPVRVRVRLNDSDIRQPAIFTTTAILPGTTNFYDLGASSNTWKNIYASSLIGNVTGNLTGNSTGLHTGNVLADDSTVLVDATTKTVTAAFSGTLTGTVIGDVVGTANNAVTLNGLSSSVSATANTLALRDANGFITASKFIGTADNADRLKIDNSAVDTDPDYKSAKTTATANTIVARNSSGDVFANVFQGTATAARYADLAEVYKTSGNIPVGTIISICDHDEYEADIAEDTDIPVGVISENPAYLMNSEAEGQAIALVGRVPIRVVGPIKKGQQLFLAHSGVGSCVNNGKLVGIALESSDIDDEKLIECILKV